MSNQNLGKGLLIILILGICFTIPLFMLSSSLPISISEEISIYWNDILGKPFFNNVTQYKPPTYIKASNFWVAKYVFTNIGLNWIPITGSYTSGWEAYQILNTTGYSQYRILWRLASLQAGTLYGTIYGFIQGGVNSILFGNVSMLNANTKTILGDSGNSENYFDWVDIPTLLRNKSILIIPYMKSSVANNDPTFQGLTIELKTT